MDNGNGTPVPAGIATLSVEQITDLERRIRENKKAQLAGEPPPHTVTAEEMAAAVNGLRAQRGTMELAGTRAAKKTGNKNGGTAIELLHLEGL